MSAPDGWIEDILWFRKSSTNVYKQTWMSEGWSLNKYRHLIRKPLTFCLFNWSRKTVRNYPMPIDIENWKLSSGKHNTKELQSSHTSRRAMLHCKIWTPPPPPTPAINPLKWFNTQYLDFLTRNSPEPVKMI